MLNITKYNNKNQTFVIHNIFLFVQHSFYKKNKKLITRIKNISYSKDCETDFI